ncbi:hypothetical protein [Actinoplanes sp. NPDC049599]|uniref:hypothetical protein n=1 Tax=Actinoplanes sp. NPDC049599 TaxID=3363903 RepID=UPI0037B2370D
MQRRLSDLLEAAKADAPAPRYGVEDAVRAGRRLRRRRAAWATAAVAAVVAVAAVIALPRLLPGPDFDYAGGDLTATIQSYEAGPLTVTEAVQVSPGYQIAQVIGPTTKKGAKPAVRGTVTVFRPGVFDPAGFATGTAVPVGGVTGRSRPDAVAWEYAEDAWAVVRTWQARLTRAQLIAVAAGLRSTAPRTPTVGFKLTTVPAGFTLDSGGRANDATGRSALPNGSYLRLVKGDVSYRNLPDVLADPGPGVQAVEVRVYPREYGQEVPPAVQPAGYCRGDRCYRDSADGKVQIEAAGGPGTSTADLLALVKGATFAVPDDPGTWYPLTSAAG